MAAQQAGYADEMTPSPTARPTRLLASSCFAAIMAALLGSCATGHRVAGSCSLTNANALTLRVQSDDPSNVEIEIWNRGPSVVHYTQVKPQSAEAITGKLQPKSRELSWTATTRDLELLVTTDSGEATIGYVVRSDRASHLSAEVTKL